MTLRIIAVALLVGFLSGCSGDDVTVVCDDVPCITDNGTITVNVCDDEDKIKEWKKHGARWEEIFGKEDGK